MYQFHYDHWDNERFPGYVFNMSNIYNNSLSFLDDKNNLSILNEIFGYTEYYLAGILKNRFVGKSNFSYVLEQLKSIHMIKLLDSKFREQVNGLTYQGVVSINPEPSSFRGMNQKESLQLSVFHELGHVITEGNKDDIDCFKRFIYEDCEITQKLSSDGYSDFSKGFELLDEVVAQNVAESLLYDRLGKERPNYVRYQSKTLNPNGTFLSNFVEYREFQELAYQFACCFDFIKEKESMNSVLHQFSKEMFSSSFCKDMYDEIKDNDEKRKDVIIMLICMGKIKDAKYSSFGLSQSSLDVSNYFDIFHTISSKYMDDENSKVNMKVQS